MYVDTARGEEPFATFSYWVKLPICCTSSVALSEDISVRKIGMPLMRRVTLVLFNFFEWERVYLLIHLYEIKSKSSNSFKS